MSSSMSFKEMESIKALYLFGLPDSQAVKVLGFDAKGELVYYWPGNTPFQKHVALAPQNRHFASIVWSGEPPRQVPRPDIVINCICDPDEVGKSLKIAGEMTAAITAKWPDVPVFNHPVGVTATTRDGIYNAFHTLPGLHMPRVARIRPASVADVVQAAKRETGYPFLIRSCGSHQGENLVLVRGAEDHALLERFAYDGSEFYLTAFADYRSPDGLYRKGRLVMIGGAMLPRHYMTGDSWLVHDMHGTYMTAHGETRQAEEHFIRHYRDMIGPAALDSLRRIYETLGLDYLGFDFAIRENGELLIFEINPAQNVFMTLDAALFPYMGKVGEDLVAALNEAVLRKVKQAAGNIPQRTASA